VTAGQCVAAAQAASAHLAAGAYFVDLNSVSPATKVAAARIVADAGARYVEAAVMAPIGPKRIATSMLLGGPHAEEFLGFARELGFAGARFYAAEVGRASAAKMCRSIIIKGLEALVAESLLTARRYGVESTVLESLRDLLPGADWPELSRYMLSRSLQHGRRRAEEMREVATTVGEAGIDPLMSTAIAARQDWAARHAAAARVEPLTNCSTPCSPPSRNPRRAAHADHRLPWPLHDRTGCPQRLSRAAAGKAQATRARSRRTRRHQRRRDPRDDRDQPAQAAEERGADLTLFSPRASAMGHHQGNAAISLDWSRACNDLIGRVVGLYPDNFVGVCQLPQSPGVPIADSIAELTRCVTELGFVGCNLNPDPSGGHWTSPPLTDRQWYPFYERMVELDVPAMVHVSASCNPNFHATGAHYINADTTAFMQFIEGDLFKDFPALRFVIPHGGGAVPYHWGRYRGLADMLKRPPLAEHVMRNVYFDTCVYHQPASTSCSGSSISTTSCSGRKWWAPCAASTRKPVTTSTTPSVTSMPCSSRMLSARRSSKATRGACIRGSMRSSRRGAGDRLRSHRSARPRAVGTIDRAGRSWLGSARHLRPVHDGRRLAALSPATVAAAFPVATRQR
jgi:3-hydroxyisobutyrate dehydrogenase-like beta-hydroxyacid dehydrogenase/predicted TIM-barrel fold metal-dependent hydrolase